ncbi:MAG: hypothetical protein EBE86_008275 [Hormoscilla sp. GUM202]|nr:hypothetical protein [Hormoscilla sp. GUM202]
MAGVTHLRAIVSGVFGEGFRAIAILVAKTPELEPARDHDRNQKGG